MNRPQLTGSTRRLRALGLHARCLNSSARPLFQATARTEALLRSTSAGNMRRYTPTSSSSAPAIKKRVAVRVTSASSKPSASSETSGSTGKSASTKSTSSTETPSITETPLLNDTRQESRQQFQELFLTLRPFFRESSASSLRKRKDIITHLYQRKSLVQPFLDKYGEDGLYSMTKELVAGDTFVKPSVAKGYFPSLEYPLPEPPALEEIEEEETSSSLEDLEELDPEELSDNDGPEAAGLGKEDDGVIAPSASTDFFSYPAQHVLLTNVQSLLEQSHFEFLSRVAPSFIDAEQWDCVEKAALDESCRYMWENFATVKARAGIKTVKSHWELLTKACLRMRNCAVHRNSIPIHVLRSWMQNATLMTELIGDHKRADQLESVIAEIDARIAELQRAKTRTHARWRARIRYINAKRAELDKLEADATEELQVKDSESLKASSAELKESLLKIFAGDYTASKYTDNEFRREQEQRAEKEKAEKERLAKLEEERAELEALQKERVASEQLQKEMLERERELKRKRDKEKEEEVKREQQEQEKREKALQAKKAKEEKQAAKKKLIEEKRRERKSASGAKSDQGQKGDELVPQMGDLAATEDVKIAEKNEQSTELFEDPGLSAVAAEEEAPPATASAEEDSGERIVRDEPTLPAEELFEDGPPAAEVEGESLFAEQHEETALEAGKERSTETDAKTDDYIDKVYLRATQPSGPRAFTAGELASTAVVVRTGTFALLPVFAEELSTAEQDTVEAFNSKEDTEGAEATGHDETTVRSTQASMPTEPVEPVEPVGAPEVIESVEADEPTAHEDSAVLAEQVEPAEPIEPAEPLESIETIESVENFEPTETFESADAVEHLEAIEHFESIESEARVEANEDLISHEVQIPQPGHETDIESNTEASGERTHPITAAMLLGVESKPHPAPDSIRKSIIRKFWSFGHSPPTSSPTSDDQTPKPGTAEQKADLPVDQVQFFDPTSLDKH